MGRLFLAPMEGLADSLLRDLLTRQGGFDGAVAEFVRVSGSVLPARTFRRVCPELLHGSRTPSGTPVAVQLLGSEPEMMAGSAARLAALHPAAIDLNFGCPAPTVNRHGGGAMLLADPVRLRVIASAVRRAVPDTIPVTAKMRLGVEDTEKALACASALASAGITALTVHARTKADGYGPCVRWAWVARIREAMTRGGGTAPVPVIANGEVWTLDDYFRCRAVTGCADVMLGRGAVADPFLARRIRAALDGQPPGSAPHENWPAIIPLLAEFWRRVAARLNPRHAPGRAKLWLNFLRRTFPPAEDLYQATRNLYSPDEFEQALRRAGVLS